MKYHQRYAKKSVAQIEEMNHSFPGINIEYRPIRKYYYSSLASHVLGYVGKIGNEEYTQNEGYELDDYIGKTGIEYVCEKILKRERWIKTNRYVNRWNNNRRIYYGRSDFRLKCNAYNRCKSTASCRKGTKRKYREKINNGDYGEKT